jgi:hypothetical protein
VAVYNSAGEVVKTIARVGANSQMTSAELTIGGVITTNMVSGEGTFNLYLAGVETKDTQGSGGTNFSWSGDNDQSQFIGPGAYYLKVEETDPYGHVVTITKDISVIDGREYVELNIYNAAGELIRKQRQYGLNYSGYALNIDVPDLISIDPAGNNSISIKYTGNASDVLAWDGRTGAGMTVSNGIYEIQIIVKDDIRGMVSASKTVTVLGAAKAFLGKLSIVPNPLTQSDFDSLGGVEIRWDFGAPAWQPNYPLAVPGTVRIMILDAAGGLVRELTGNLAAGTINWDTKTPSGRPVAGGVYIVVVEARSASGYLERKMQKIAIIRGSSLQ